MEISHPRASFSSSRGDSTEFDTDLTLSDRIKAFKSSNFDPEGYVTNKCHAMSEKEIRHLCSYLVDLKKASAEEMRKSVYANYSAFIRTSREISDLEGQLLSLRNFLSTQSTLIHGLAEGIRLESLSSGSEGSRQEDVFDFEDREPSETEKWLAQFLENLEVLLAERRVKEALEALDEGERMAKDPNNRKTLTSSALLSLKTTITEQRQKLADQLAEAACQPSTRSVELRSAVQALKQLGDGPRAHNLLLKSHHQKLQYNMQGLRPSGASDGAAYTATFSQLVFSTIAQAASDSLAVLGDEPAYASELVTWAVKQTEDFSLLVKRHVLASSAAAGGLRVVAECVQICLGHCYLLESRGLALSPVLLRLFRPCIEQALSANLKRIEQSTAAFAAADEWSLAYPSVGARPLSSASFGSVIASQPKLSSSAHRFNSMAQELCEDVGALESPQFADNALEGLVQAFNSYVNMLINALPGSMETENLEVTGSRIVRMAESESQQIALLANALLIADELLPRAATKLQPFNQTSRIDEPPRRPSDRQNRAPEQRELKKRLQRFVDQLRDSFCRQHALELIFTDDGGVRLGAHMYISMDGNADEPEWFPSPIYQELFAKLTRIASIASDMFVGRERFATMLLMRLTETVILWLSEDQSFWEEIEAGPTPLGPLGLQQFYLDMEFVILFASQGRYLSRNLHQVIKNIIGRAIESVAATGIDPYGSLPEDDWFAEVAQIAIKMLTGKANFGNVDHEVVSPTASVSAKSTLSHGSN
ncbi:LOW QUALITY PROTEIN: exocyst complex component EXO84A [Actinidia eriantha]|uniref:LOW QUALITY PROTEIN: exocyst complex component EXO84A n=1 Tax=Actinidia eriantha TaxID=165200 RepID=UPI0025874FA6|nr:LOW QUALITY PROTEIN: exocyst complex component EXO84A [Actinidia eriantha]